MMRTVMTVLIGVALILLQAPPVSAATYYIAPTGSSDANPCTQASPCRTADKGVSMMAGGDTLYLRGGTYVDDWFSGPQWPPKPGVPSGTASQRTTIAAFPGETVILTNSGFSMGGGASYIIFEGLTLINGNFYCDGTCHHIRVQYCDFDSSTAPNPATADEYTHPISGTGDFIEILHNKIHDTPTAYFTDASGVTNGKYGMYFTGNNCLVEGNEIYRTSGYGIHWFSAGSFDYDNNVFRGNTIWGCGGDDGTRANGAAAMIVSSGHNNVVYNNVIYGNTAGIQIGGACANCQIYNNTVYNNTLVDPGTGPLNAGCVSNLGTLSIVRNNICYANMGTEIQDYAGGLSQSKNWLTPSGNPMFVNAPAGDFHLQAGSPAINAGDPVPVVTTDIAGTPRPQPSGGAYDIGAYEYSVAGPCPPDCPVDESPTVAAVIVDSDGATHGTTPSDANGCRTAENLATPKATIASALACMTLPCKHMALRGGTHAGFFDTATLPLTGGASWACPTVIRPHASEVPVVQLPVTHPGAVMAFQTPTTQYVEVRGLTLDGMSRAEGDGLLVIDSSNLRFKDLIVRNNRYQNVAIIDSSNIELLTSTLTTPLSYANVVLYGTSANTLISGNTISSGVLAGVLFDASATVSGSTITKNTITNTMTGVDVGPGPGTLVQNNLITGQSGDGIHVRAGATDWKVYHNDTVSNGGTGLLCDSGATGGDFANNIAVANAAQLVNPCGAQNRGNTLTGTLAALFTSATTGDYTLKVSVPASPAINSGIALPAVTEDLAGNVRPYPVGGLPDAGAYEAQSAPATGPSTGVSVRILMFYAQ